MATIKTGGKKAKTKIELDQRRIKVVELIAKGMRPYHISQNSEQLLGVKLTPPTIIEDYKAGIALSYGMSKKDYSEYAQERLLQLGECATKLFIDFHKAATAEERVKIYGGISKVIADEVMLSGKPQEIKIRFEHQVADVDAEIRKVIQSLPTDLIIEEKDNG